MLYGYHPGELPSKIYKVEIATGKQTVVQELRPGAPAGVVIVAPVVVSRDGTRFAYSYNQALSVLYSHLRLALNANCFSSVLSLQSNDPAKSAAT